MILTLQKSKMSFEISDVIEDEAREDEAIHMTSDTESDTESEILYHSNSTVEFIRNEMKDIEELKERELLEDLSHQTSNVLLDVFHSNACMSSLDIVTYRNALFFAQKSRKYWKVKNMALCQWLLEQSKVCMTI
jgi:hypothetical protein